MQLPSSAIREALDANDALLQSRTFTNVPLRNGYKTTYRGTFFGEGDGEITLKVARDALDLPATLEAWEAAQKAGKRLPDNFAQRLKDALRAELYGR